METQTPNETQCNQKYLYYAEEHYENKNRFKEYLIDFIVSYVLFGLISFPLWLEDVDDIYVFIIGAVVGTSPLFGVFYFLYYFIMESIWGKTIGKFIYRMKVVDHNGNKPSLKSIAWRSFVRLFPFEPFSYIDRKKKGGWRDDHRFYKRWHEGFSNAYTVSDK